MPLAIQNASSGLPETTMVKPNGKINFSCSSCYNQIDTNSQILFECRHMYHNNKQCLPKGLNTCPLCSESHKQGKKIEKIFLV